MKIHPARAEDYDLIRALLVASELPVEDVTENSSIRFFIAESAEAKLGGCIGLEAHGRDGLLRSLAVQQSLRAQGVGRALVDAVQGAAATAGIKRLWLLTTTANTFFLRSGYEVADRAAAPGLIRRSPQFASICPANAMCMTRALQ
ncbi:arsenic resistance N-acetyltransferase ArsN2 [Caballeronia sp. SEWSISQ10-4 2]|uniref:arsenic resistance N-acetyltransferase ArsN2 n=1 Tax=Caballeronia sp. SEWSISQ10-4 2 TaxID=2937438 RepID=UPI00346248B3